MHLSNVSLAATDVCVKLRSVYLNTLQKDKEREGERRREKEGRRD